MFVLVELFDGLIERTTQVVGYILSALGEPDSCLGAFCMGGIHTLCIVGVVLGNGCAFTLAWVMLLSRNKSSLSLAAEVFV
jgi:hypothetical protein